MSLQFQKKSGGLLNTAGPGAVVTLLTLTLLPAEEAVQLGMAETTLALEGQTTCGLTSDKAHGHGLLDRSGDQSTNDGPLKHLRASVAVL